MLSLPSHRRTTRARQSMSLASAARRVALALLAVATPLSAQQSAAFQRMLAIDSTLMGVLQTSPDDRWLLYVRNAAGRSLWIAPAAGGTPVRLTSDGFQDQLPFWSPSGDRIVFVSNRPVRDGANVRYAMMLSVDPASGRAGGAPRQITTEPVQVAAPSADGRSVVYLTPQPEQVLKIIPATGGTARTVARIGGRSGMLFVDKSGTSAYVRTIVPEAKSDTVRLYRVPLAGGQPELLVSADHLVAPLLADPRYVVHFRVPQFASSASGTAEVRTVAGERIGEVTVPRGVAVTGWPSAGWGFLGQKREGKEQVRIVAVDRGEPRTVATRGFPEAWMPDSKTIIADRPEGVGNDYVVDLIPVDGGPVRTLPLPTNGQHSNIGWNSSVGPFFSMLRDDRSLMAMDVRSGQTREISRDVARTGVVGRGGLEQDGNRWVYFQRAADRLELRSADPATGESRVIRAFPATFDVGPRVAVNGHRVAMIEAGKDSLRVVVTNGANGQPRRVASFPARRDFEIYALAWSWDSTRLGVTYLDRSVRNETSIAIFDVPLANAEPIRRRDIRTGSDGACYFLKWLPDASGIVVSGIVPGRRQADLILIPTNGSRPRALTNEPAGVWEGVELSPDGRTVFYWVVETTNTSVWKLDLRPIIKSR